MEVNQVRRDLWPSLQDTPKTICFLYKNKRKTKTKCNTQIGIIIYEKHRYIERARESTVWKLPSLYTQKKEEIEFFKSRSQQLAANYKNYNYEKKNTRPQQQQK